MGNGELRKKRNLSLDKELLECRWYCFHHDNYVDPQTAKKRRCITGKYRRYSNCDHLRKK